MTAIGWLGFVVCLLIGGDFALDALALRRDLANPATTRWVYDLGALKVTAKYFATAVLLAWMSVATRRWRRAHGHRAKRAAAPVL